MTRSVIITGGFGVLGSAVAETFVKAGDKVVRIDFVPAAPSELTGAVDVGGVDLTDAAVTQAVFTDIADKQGGIDVLANVAGGFVWETLGDGSPESWTRMYRMNVLTAVMATDAALSEIRKSRAGRIVNIGAGAAIKADTGMGAYAASKSGIHRLTEALAAELSDTNVTVNAILPSIIDTPTNRADMPDADFSQWVKPEAIAEVIHFLASPAARSVTGALIPATRGQSE